MFRRAWRFFMPSRRGADDPLRGRFNVMIVIRGGEVLTDEGWQRTDVRIADGRVAAIGTAPSAEVVVDASGCLVGPGFVDMHTHLREPGQTWKEDIASGSASAAAGGFTAVTAMPNTDPPVDTPKVVKKISRSAAKVGLVEVVPSAALTVGRAGTAQTEFRRLYEVGVRLFTDDGDSVSDARVLEEAMFEIATLPGAVVAQHAEDAVMTTGRHMHEGAVSRSHGLAGMPPEAETGVVRRDLDLAARTGASYHCQHVSAKMTVELIRQAKESGMRVTAEVTPHHLTFDDTSLAALDPNLKMYPPLRSPADRESLIEALREGVIDAVATDHAPHLPGEKAVGFEAAPRGVIGLETAASAVWEVVTDRDQLFRTLSMNPARILGLEEQGRTLRSGRPANLVVFDPNATWHASHFRSKSSNSPYLGHEMRGRVVATISRGQLVYAGGAQ